MNRNTLKDLIKKHEGLRLKPYKCSAGRTTIGYGRNLDDVGINVGTADSLLDEDIAQAERDVRMIFPGFDLFAESRQHALVDMCFNLGLTRFREFRRMISAIQAGNWNLAADEAKNSRWYTQVKSRAVTIVNMIRNG